MSFYPRGDVYYVERFQTIGSEQRSGRPAIIVSNNTNNKYSGVVEVVYLTTQPKTDLPTHVPILATGIPSTALCEQVHSVDCSRLGNYCGRCTEEELQSIDNALLISLGLSMGGEISSHPKIQIPLHLRRTRLTPALTPAWN